MSKSTNNTSTLGVYYTDAEGETRLVHRYQGGDYGLEEIIEYFQLGHVEPTEREGETVVTEREGETVVVLTAEEMRELKAMADAYSFDYEEGFIEMCLEIHRFASGLPGDTFHFTANF